jgi:uncharacterized membrane protein YccF (DUF307 family)
MLRCIVILVLILATLPLLRAAWSISSRYEAIPYATNHRAPPVSPAQR